jgi:hypothetical protein
MGSSYHRAYIKIDQICNTRTNHIDPINKYLTNLMENFEVPTSAQLATTRVLTLFQAQSHIGWDQILKGRFSLTWLPLISNITFFATRWLIYTIKKIWNTWYDMWKHRCDVNQGETPEYKTARLKQ